MLVRKFEADTMAAALKQVKDALGPEALILATRTLGKKGLGVLGRQTIEVTAAIESPAMKTTPRQGYADTPARGLESPARPTGAHNRIETLDDEVVTLSRRPTPAAPPAPAAGRDKEEKQDLSQLKNEIDQLKELIHQLAHAQNEQHASAAHTRTSAEPMPVPVAGHGKKSPAQRPGDLIERLKERGIDESAAVTIADYADPRMNQQQHLDPHQQRSFLCTTLAGLVQTCGPLWSAGDAQKKISLIGATGVGKTTTIAKLAARAISESGARVALVTIDTYRIAAVEQLKVYGEIMGIPVEVVFSPDQLQESFRRHRDKDLILIDTAGRSPQDQARIEELDSFLGSHSEVENLLVLAAPTAERLQQKSLAAFGRLPISGLIFTKLDETDCCGCLINLPLQCNLPIHCLTNGQNVPEDLLPADPQLVAEIVMGEEETARRMAV